MVVAHSLKYWADFLGDCRTQSAIDSVKLLTNKSIYVAEHTLHRLFGRTLGPDHDWAKTPFRLSSCVKWSKELGAWYVIEDLSSIISMQGAGSEPQEWILDELLPGMVMLDVGAHHGRYSISASRKVGANGFVAAVEPHPRNVQILQKNLDINHINNVRIFRLACWSERATLNSKSATLLALHAVSAEQGEGSSISGIPLDLLADDLRLTRLDWIKIDVEGAELAVLDGAKGATPISFTRVCMLNIIELYRH